MAQIATTAVVNRQAEVDDDVEIGPYAIVGPHVRVGAGTTIGAHAIVEGHTTLGKGCRIFPHAAVGLEPQDLKYCGASSRLVIGDRTVVREFATLNIATADGETTAVGSDCLLMAYSHVAHNCVLGDRVILANSVNLAGHVTVEDWAIIGGVTPVHQFVRIGAHSMIGGGSRIPQDVAPYTLVSGIPPQTYGVNTVGMARRGFDETTMKAVKQAYRILFRQKLGVEEAVARVRETVTCTPEVLHLLQFFLSSERGVTR